MTTTRWRRPLESPSSGDGEGPISEPPQPEQRFASEATGCATTLPRRQARDTRNGRVGDIMPNPIPAHLRDPDRPSSVMLRPPGGGCEWAVPPECVQLLERGAS